MNMIESLLGSQSGTLVRHLGQQFGLDESQASSALGALLPSLAAGATPSRPRSARKRRPG